MLAGLAYRLSRKVDTHQMCPRAERDLQSVAAAPARQVQNGVARADTQGSNDLGDPLPAEQAGGQQVWRQPELPLLDLVLRRRADHLGVPAIEIGRGQLRLDFHPIIMPSANEDTPLHSPQTRISDPTPNCGQSGGVGNPV